MGIATNKADWTDDQPPTLNAQDLNEIKRGTNTLISTTGVVPDLTTDQTAIAVSNYSAAGDFYNGSAGVADAYIAAVIGTRKLPGVYFDGMRIRFIIPVTNTGAPVTVNVGALGVQSVVLRDDTDPVADDMTAGEIVEMFYNGVDFVISTTVTSIIQEEVPPPPFVPAEATPAEMEAATSDDTFVSPRRVVSSPSALKAFVLFDGEPAIIPAPLLSLNVASVVRVGGNGTGQYDVTFSIPFSSSNYICTGNTGETPSTGTGGNGVDNMMTLFIQTSSVCRAISNRTDGTIGTEDANAIFCNFAGDQ